MSKADSLGGSATFDAVAQPISSRAASFAAFAGQSPTAPVATPHGSLRIDVGRLAPNPYNPRVTLAAIEEMADSLTSKGIIQPLTIVTRDAFLAAHPEYTQDLAAAEYVVVDGNRRLAGAKLAGLDDVPVHLDDELAQDADTLLEAALVAAVQHEDLEPLDEAKALERLVQVHGSQRAVARSLGKSSGWVTQRLALLKLTPELKQAVESRTLPVKIARTVGQLPEQEQQRAVDEAFAQRLQHKNESTQKTRSAYPVSTPTGSSTQRQGKPADPNRSQQPDDDMATLAADLKRRLTAPQIEKLVELLMD
ncbi:ParB/RepB/Spo0J family partition protein [Streptomyces sp. NBC_01789]|uniref:ParB/RepB/Spo0J family partition protein n=1 Tax=Streptomyces sp. NBC_01789 TaxID=2975941 RepID=UPI00225580AB|nr:ParB/RepB/Spo0J family partition protein [Streptomyces sp. NBC_01789]MCX4451679.1 ParB/RepB/Spo0J family partition protein [Streptomyces sp. NBC_01789]